MLLKRLILLLVSVVGFAQVPTVSNITVTDLNTTSFRVFFNVSGVAGAWAEGLYGTTSGVYPYSTKSANTYGRTDAPATTGLTAMTVSGLTPGTTYYFLPTARPNPDNDTNICKVSGCGAVEQVITTLTGPQPNLPTQPTSWVPPLPDTSTGYTLIPLQVGGTGECQAASTVSYSGTNGSWTVTAGTYIPAILSTITYGTVLEIPQGVSCLVPPQVSGTGYGLPAKAADNNCGGACALTDPRHRWIIFRTQQINSGDFPPFGSRTGPDYAPVLAKFYSAQPNAASQLFDAEQGTGTIHHYWWQNVEFEDGPAYVNPANYVDPVAFNFFVRAGSTFQTANNEFLVFDRVYAHSFPAPIRHLQAYELGGNYIAMVGCWTSQIATWRMTLWPTNPPPTTIVAGLPSAASVPNALYTITDGTTTSDCTSGGGGSSSKTVLCSSTGSAWVVASSRSSGGGAVISVPQNNFRYAVSSSTLGMSGSNLVNFSGLSGSGTILGNLSASGLDVQYTTGVGTLTCVGCTGSPASSPATPPTALLLFSASVSGGAITGVNWNVFEATSIYPLAFGIQTSDLKAAGGPYYFDNNYIDGVGEGFYMDSQYSAFSNDDITYTHNHHIWPKQFFALDPGNQWRYEVREHWESKRGHRILLKGSVFSRSWSFQNTGMSIFLSGRSPYIVAVGSSDGIQDVTMRSNIISHGRSGIECDSGNALDNGGGSQPEPSASARIQITNNLMFDLGRWLYCDPIGCPALTSNYFVSRPACQDLVIDNNTLGITYGEIPSLFYFGGGQNLGNYLSFQNNVLYFSQNSQQGYGGLSFGDWPANNVANHDVTPSTSYTNGGSAPPFTVNLAGTFVNTAATVTTGHYLWRNNVLLYGYVGCCAVNAVTDLSYSAGQTYAANMPSGAAVPNANTILARQAQVGFMNPASGVWNYNINLPSTYTPGGIGVNYATLYSDQGLVTGILPPQVNGSTATFNYLAPDSRACTIDIQISGGSVWTRTTDAGGGKQRSTSLTGLANGTYNYRLLCYYKQVNDGVLYLDFTPDEATNGTFTMVATHTAAASFPFTLSAVPGATKVTVQLTPPGGAPVSQTCTTSPCGLSVTSGVYGSQIQYLSSGNVVLSSTVGTMNLQ